MDTRYVDYKLQIYIYLDTFTRKQQDSIYNATI